MHYTEFVSADSHRMPGGVEQAPPRLSGEPGGISRRALLTVPLLAACGRRRGGAGFRGYAFVANEEGEAIAAVDMETLSVARHIPLAGAPSSVISAGARPSVYALTPRSGTVHEIDVDRLSLTRKLAAASSGVSMHMVSD